MGSYLEAGRDLEALDVPDVGAGEVVDALQVVADDDHSGEVAAGEELDEAELGGVGVLELVDDDELVAAGVGLADYGVLEDAGAELDHVLVAQQAAGGPTISNLSASSIRSRRSSKHGRARRVWPWRGLPRSCA